MKKLTAFAVLTLVSAPPIQGNNKQTREQREEERGLFDVVCAAVPYALSAGALYFCYQLQQRVGTLEAQIKKLDKIDGLEQQTSAIEKKRVEDFEALSKRFEAERKPVVVQEPPSRPDSRNTDDFVQDMNVSGNPSPTHANTIAKK